MGIVNVGRVNVGVNERVGVEKDGDESRRATRGPVWEKKSNGGSRVMSSPREARSTTCKEGEVSGRGGRTKPPGSSFLGSGDKTQWQIAGGLTRV